MNKKYRILIADDEKEIREYKAKELRFKPRKRRDVKLSKEEMKRLAKLEEN